MTSRDFCFWLQGYFEISSKSGILDASQCELIRKHLALVFVHEIDPSMGSEQTKLNTIHQDGSFLNKPPYTKDNAVLIARC